MDRIAITTCTPPVCFAFPVNRVSGRDAQSACGNVTWRSGQRAGYVLPVEQYRVYLRAELGKLRNVGDGQKFLGTVGCRTESFDVPRDVHVLSERFATQETVGAFVDGLEDQALIDLTACCGLWRKNGIARNLARWQSPYFIDVPVENVLLKRAEEVLWPVFDRLQALTTIGTDSAVLAHPVYAAHSRNEQIEYRWCLANPEPGRQGIYRIFDGTHRAVQMMRNGETHIPLCVVEAP
jgi:hypothetical protein